MSEDTGTTATESQAPVRELPQWDGGEAGEDARTHPAEGQDTEGQPPAQDPKEPKEDLSNLLGSDEPESDGPRVRVADGKPSRVDHSERLRNYYARIYRPKHNPSRIYFGARGGFGLSGTSAGAGGGRMGFVNAELGQTWNFIGYGIGTTVYAGSLTFGDLGIEQYGGLLVGGGPSLGLGRLALLGRGYFDARVGYNFFYAPVLPTTQGQANPPDAAPHGPKIQIDAGLLLHDSEGRRFRHGIGVTAGWQILVHSFAGPYPVVNTFNIGISYFFG